MHDEHAAGGGGLADAAGHAGDGTEQIEKGKAVMPRD